MNSKLCKKSISRRSLKLKLKRVPLPTTKMLKSNQTLLATLKMKLISQTRLVSQQLQFWVRNSKISNKKETQLCTET